MSNEDRSQCRYGFVATTLVGLLVTSGMTACEERQPPGDAKKEAPAVATNPESAAGETKPAMPDPMADVVLSAPASSLGRASNDEGVDHARQGHWDVAEGHFRKALEDDPKLAEAQFNLGLALDRLGKHEDATAAFKKAVELAPGNSRIKDSPILKKHMST